MGVVLWLWHFRLPTVSTYNRSKERLWTQSCTKVQKQIEEWLNDYRLLWGLNEDDTGVSSVDVFNIKALPLVAAEDTSSRLAHSINRLDIHNTLRISDGRKGGDTLDIHRRKTHHTSEKVTPTLPSLKSMGLLTSEAHQSHHSTPFVKMGPSKGCTPNATQKHLLPPIASSPPATKTANSLYHGSPYRYS